MSDRSPGRGRYAWPEREQRWVVRAMPADARPAATIVDRYVEGTRLRLRRSETDGQVLYKLAQKVRDDPLDPATVRLTNIYLAERAYAALLALPAAELRKSRWRATWMGRTVAIDRFGGRLDRLLLAEAELGPDEPPLPAPPWVARDVTNDDRFSGGSLAFADDGAIEDLLREVATFGRGAASARS